MAGGDRLGTERGDTKRRQIDARRRRGIRFHGREIGNGAAVNECV